MNCKFCNNKCIEYSCGWSCKNCNCFYYISKTDELIECEVIINSYIVAICYRIGILNVFSKQSDNCLSLSMNKDTLLALTPDIIRQKLPIWLTFS